MTTTDLTEDALAPTYSLSLTGEGITVQREVTTDVARDIIAVVMGGTPGARAQKAVPSGSAPRSSVGMSLREFIDATGATKNPQIVTAIGLYLMDQEGQERFTRGEAKTKFSDAGEPTPANIGRDVALAKSSGWIAENPRNEFYVTDSGRRAVEVRFEGHTVRRPRRRATTRRVKQSAKES